VIDQLPAIDALHHAFAANDVPYWLFGGWAVDFHVGRVTRAHDDIDIAAWLRDRATIRRLLEEAGWNALPEHPDDGYDAFEQAGGRIEVAWLVQDDDGAVYTPVPGGRGDWPTECFGRDVAILEGVAAHVIARGALIADKSEPHGGPEALAKDRPALAVLTAPGDAP
jgi:hypothetical protein